jgi:hypothetical protein
MDFFKEDNDDNGESDAETGKKEKSKLLKLLMERYPVRIGRTLKIMAAIEECDH